MLHLSRRGLRALRFHLLYALEANDYEISLAAVIDNFNRGFNLEITKSDDIMLLQVMADDRDKLDQIIMPVLANWKLERIGINTKLILRLGLWELLHTTTPTNIVINEAVELAKNFSEDGAYRFINGILDQLARQVRKDDSKVIST